MNWAVLEGCRRYCNVPGLQKTPCDTAYSSASLVWSLRRGLWDERKLSSSWGGNYPQLSLYCIWGCWGCSKYVHYWICPPCFSSMLGFLTTGCYLFKILPQSIFNSGMFWYTFPVLKLTVISKKWRFLSNCISHQERMFCWVWFFFSLLPHLPEIWSSREK